MNAVRAPAHVVLSCFKLSDRNAYNTSLNMPAISDGGLIENIEPVSLA